MCEAADIYIYESVGGGRKEGGDGLESVMLFLRQFLRSTLLLGAYILYYVL